MSHENLRKICKYTTKTTVIDFTDNLKINNFLDKNSNKKSTVHENYSRIKVTIVDWSKGKKENAVVVQYNLEPEIIKALAYLILNNRYEYFGYTDTSIRKPLFSKYKINHHTKNEKGFSPVSKLEVTYETGLKSGPKWRISIENGEAIPVIGSEGQVTYNVSTYTSNKKASIFISPFDAIALMLDIFDYINNFELVHFNNMIKNRNSILENKNNLISKL